MKNYSDILHKLSYNIDSSHVDYRNMDIDIFIPENKEEIIEILNKAIEDNKKVIIRGGGTNLVGNVLPPKNSYIIDVSKLNKIIDYSNESVILEPGVVLDNLNIFLNNYNKVFPVVPGSHAGAQIGSMISTNASGMRALKYGKMEQWVNYIDVLIVDIDKKIQEKRIDSEDIKDFLNAEGILGVITQISLKTADKPKITSINFPSFENIDDLILNTINLLSKKEDLDISAIEFIDKKVAGFLGLNNAYYLLTEFENENGDIKDQQEKDKIWAIRDSCYPVVVSNGYELIEDPLVDISKIKELILWLENNSIPTFGHIGTGILHPHYNKNQEELIKQMYDLVKELGGKVSGEHGIGIKKKTFIDEKYKERFRILKSKYDPCNIFGGENIL